MKKSIYLLPISLLSLPIASTIASCSCKINVGYVAIPTTYLNIENNKLIGFKDPEEDLDKYDTLQIPSNVVSVSGFIYKPGDKAYKAIKNIIADNNGSLTTIETTAFSYLPELTKIVLPKTITTIKDSAFNCLIKLNTIDLSNISNISIIKSNQFKGLTDPTQQVTKGTIIVSNNDHKNALINTFKDNDWLKGWDIVVK